MARRRIEVSEVKEILVQWDAGAEISTIARALDYSRPTVRKYVRAAEAVGLVRGAERRREADWEELAREAIARVANVRTPGEASQEVARFHATIERQLGEVQLSVRISACAMSMGSAPAGAPSTATPGATGPSGQRACRG